MSLLDMTGQVSVLVYGKSDDVAVANDTERSTTSGSYEIMKDMNLLFSGNVRTRFQLKTGQVAYYAYGRVYKNGAAYGTERSNNTMTYVAYIEDLDFTYGDSFSIYGHGSGGYSCLVNQQRILGGPYAEINPDR